MKAIEWVNLNKKEILENIKQLISIPSVSAEKEYASSVLQAAEWVKNNFTRINLESKLLNSKGYPVVYASTKINPDKPTVLCYFHYDVQPTGDESLWKTPPFQPTEIDGKLYARGTTDDKMQGLIHVVALEAMMNSNEELPVNFKFVIEGEEEIASPFVMDVIEENRELFDCDSILISDGTMISPDLPCMEVGTRGILYSQIRVTIGEKDMHSGQFGGIVKNANFELIKILNKLKDENGKVQIPGFYDNVVMPTSSELESWSSIPKTEEEHRSDAGVFELDKGEVEYSLIERNWSRPTMEVNGVWGGFTGEGSKTVIPFEAFAKVSFRLVPDQDPNDIENKLRDYLKTFENEGVKVELQWTEKAYPFLSSPTDPIYDKAREAYEKVFGKKALLTRTGGTIGLLAGLKRVFDKPILLMNFGSPDECMHAPNEFMRINNFFKGIETSILLWESLRKN